jgi:hypothetical protein
VLCAVVGLALASKYIVQIPLSVEDAVTVVAPPEYGDVGEKVGVAAARRLPDVLTITCN